MMSFPDASPSDGPFVLTEHDAGDVLDLYARCIDYFMLQDGEPATLADAIELFRDVPEGKSAIDQTVMGWRGQNGLMAVVPVLRDYPSYGVWYLGFMIVDASARGKGIGRSIYDAIERWVVDRGAQEIRLAVLEVTGRRRGSGGRWVTESFGGSGLTRSRREATIASSYAGRWAAICQRNPPRGVAIVIPDIRSLSGREL